MPNDNTNRSPLITLHEGLVALVVVMIMAVVVMVVVVVAVVVVVVVVAVVVVVVEVLLQAEGGRAAAVRVAAVAVPVAAGPVRVPSHGLHGSHGAEAEHDEQQLHEPPAAVVALSLQHLRERRGEGGGLIQEALERTNILRKQRKHK